MADHQHHHEEEDGTYGIALGFRIIEEGGELFLVEAEIAPYVDSPEELGVTLVFHPLEGVNPVEVDEEVDWPSWPVDIDDDLSRDPSAPLDRQFAQIARQLHGLSTEKLVEYLGIARQDAGEEV
jgi:hypothetical protein